MNNQLEELVSSLVKYEDPAFEHHRKFLIDQIAEQASAYLLNGEALIPARVANLRKAGYSLIKEEFKAPVTVTVWLGINTKHGNVFFFKRAPKKLTIKKLDTVDNTDIIARKKALEHDSKSLPTISDIEDRASLRADIGSFLKNMFGGFFR